MILAISIAINPDIGHESVQNSLTELGEAALYHFLVILKLFCSNANTGNGHHQGLKVSVRLFTNTT